MIIDRVAASKNYQKENYTDRSALEYYEHGRNIHILHKDTKRMLELLLHMLAEEGEEKTLSFIKNEVLTGKVPY